MILCIFVEKKIIKTLIFCFWYQTYHKNFIGNRPSNERLSCHTAVSARKTVGIIWTGERVIEGSGPDRNLTPQGYLYLFRKYNRNGTIRDCFTSVVWLSFPNFQSSREVVFLLVFNRVCFTYIFHLLIDIVISYEYIFTYY